jgi:pSer/pThr/pTyr-binding forkhead associated (FHA) protein
MEVVLTAVDDRIVPEVRRLTLTTGKTMPIGRSSKSPSKPELMAAPANAYIDSPVVSREHAHFSVKPTTPGKLAVYITDNRSMHGTMINGVKLHATVPNRLFDGDELQFGSDVSRNESMTSAPLVSGLRLTCRL